MARKRSIIGNLWLQLSLQAAFAVGAAHAAQVAEHTFANYPLVNAADTDAFVYTVGAGEVTPPSFEDFSLDFYLPPEPQSRDDYVALPNLDYALLGGPEHNYDMRADDFILLN